jgi:hypothetical protein
MKQNTKKFGLTWGALLLVGTAALAPCLVSAEDGEGGPLILGPGGIITDGSGEYEPVTPSFGSPGADDILFEQPPYAPYEAWKYWPSDVDWGYRLFDEFWGLSEDIGDIH